MRILYSHRANARDSQHAHIVALVRALRQAGHEVNVAGPGVSGGDSNPLLELAWQSLPGAAAEWVERARDNAACKRLARAAALFKPDLIYERSAPFLTAGARISQLTNTLFYLDVSGMLTQNGQRPAPRAARQEIASWHAAHRVLPATTKLADMIAATGVPRDRITVMPTGIDAADIARPIKARGEPVALLYLQGELPWPGLERVIEGLGASGLADTMLTVIGDGPDMAAVAAQAGVAERFWQMSTSAAGDMRKQLPHFDIVLLPPGTADASPSLLTACMQAGCAIVAPDQPGARALLRHKHNAVLFDPAQPGFIWNAAKWLVEEPALRERLGKAAKESITQEDPSWAGIASRIVALAERDLEARRAA